jgi:tetratricopeptide (TPR) repeat protein
VEEAAAHIGAGSIAEELARALDFWCVSRLFGGPREPPRTQFLQIARLADPDPWRNQLRDALANFDRRAMLALVTAADVRNLPPQSLALIGRVLVARPANTFLTAYFEDQALETAILAFLRAAHRQYPADLLITLNLAEFCRHNHNEETLRLYSAASALRPDSPYITCNLGHALMTQRQYDEAVAVYTKALEHKADYLEALEARANAYRLLGQTGNVLAGAALSIAQGSKSHFPHFNLGWAYTRQRQWEQAVAEFAKGVAMMPRLLTPQTFVKPATPPALPEMFRHDRAYAYSVLGQWDNAAVDLTVGRDPLKAPPGDDIWLQLACLRLLQGDVPGYQQLCRQLLKRKDQDKGGQAAQIAYMSARTCVLHPQTGVAPEEAALWAKQALADFPGAAWSLHTLALAHYRAGEFAEAVRSCRESQKDEQWRGAMVNAPLLAMAYQHLGKHDESGKWLETASLWRQTVVDGTCRGDACPPEMHLSDWLTFELLWREARGLVHAR